MITDGNWAHVFILIARATTSPSRAKGEWEGFWCLSIQKAPESSIDDVFVTPDPALPQWFTLDPAQPLPNQAAEHFAHEIAKLDASPPNTTEALAVVKQWRGQELFRDALMTYWEGACAVTGITVPELLRASHAKPWARCDTDAERLNVFNGFLLCAHLDALLDRGLMTFDVNVTELFSPQIDPTTREKLALTPTMQVRWLATEHGPFLAWHRDHLFNQPKA